MKGSLIIVGFLVLGIIVGDSCGFAGWRRELLCALLPDVLCRNQHRMRYFGVEEFQGCESPIDDVAGDDYPGHPCRMRCGFLVAGTSPADGLSGNRFGIWILLVVEHLHHAISWTGVGHDSLADQYLPRDTHPALCAFAGKVFRQVGTNQCGWSHDDGYHVADYHPLFGREFHHRFHLSWFLRRFLRAVPGHVLLFVVKFELYTYNTSVL